MLAQLAADALANLVLLAGVPLLVYTIYHRRRHGRDLAEVARRAGLQLGETRYLGYSAVAAIVAVAAVVLWSPPVEPMVAEGSAFRRFAGLGIGGTAIAMALIYGVVMTGFAEELLFRGLVAGSLSRRLSLIWANVLQAAIFLLPHLLVLTVAPEQWTLLPVIFLGALFAGWVRIRSGSIVGPWLIHAAANVAVALSVAARSVA